MGQGHNTSTHVTHPKKWPIWPIDALPALHRKPDSEADSRKYLLSREILYPVPTSYGLVVFLKVLSHSVVAMK